VCRFYGGTEELMRIYAARGGIDAFGVIEHGACGFTNSDGSLVYDRAMYAAPAGL